MSKTLKTVGMIAGAVALVATGVGAFAAAGSVLASTAASVASIASLTATAANIGATLTQKPPPARGNVTQLIIAPDAPHPYLMGEGYYGGVLRHDTAYGGTVNDVPNPYRGMVVVYSGSGPVQSITPYVDKAAVSAWYSTWLYTSTQLGAKPEAAALVPNFAGMPGWDAASKLSGQAAILWNLKFDKKGKRFASGVPITGAYGQWVKVYDPRLDSTFPGGSGTHRLNDEATWTWSENPALHAGVYAYGRRQNGKRTFGIGMPVEAINFGVIAAWANVCDSNLWTIFGVIYEPGDRWQNLKDICAAGGAQPVVSSGGLLSFKYSAPQVALDTITAADIADGQVQVTKMQSWGERLNTIVPKYTSPTHEWQQVAAASVSVAAFVTEDGEEKVQEWPFNLVKKPEQAAQLAAYQLYNAREESPIVIPCMPRMRAYRPGECLALDLPDYGLVMNAIILQRQLDPATMTVTLTLVGETASKHAFALGQTPAPPATPVAGQTPQARDETTAGVNQATPYTVATEAAMLALVVPTGTIVKRTDNGQSYVYNGGTAGTIADWTLIGVTTSTTDIQEIARDALGTALVAGANITITPNDVADTITIAAAGGVTDGDKGDIVVSGSGATWSFDSAVVSVFARTILDDIDGPAVRTTIGAVGSVSPAFTGTATFQAATLTGNLTAGDDTLNDGHTFNGSLTVNANGGIILNNPNDTKMRFQAAGVTQGWFGASATYCFISYDNLANERFAVLNNATPEVRVNGLKVLTTRRTGWATPTGTATRTAFDTATVTTPQLAERVKALLDDLHATGHGLLGT